MTVKEITKYVYKGKEYNTLNDIKKEIHDTIGLEVIDKINRVAPPQKHSQLFDLLKVLCDPAVRLALIECYTVFIEKDDPLNPNYYEKINVLDL